MEEYTFFPQSKNMQLSCNGDSESSYRSTWIHEICLMSNRNQSVNIPKQRISAIRISSIYGETHPDQCAFLNAETVNQPAEGVVASFVKNNKSSM